LSELLDKLSVGRWT